jgi:glycosyltransferase involved in cell wall biosynthesis
MIRVVHVIPSLAHGGAEAMLLKLLGRWDRARLSHVVVSMTSRGPLASQIEATGWPIRTLNMRRGTPDPRGVLRLSRILRQEKADVVCTWLYHADLTGFIAAKLAGVSSVIWNIQCGELERSDHPWHLWWTIAALARLSPQVSAVVVNAEVGRHARQHAAYRPPEWALIPSGFDLDMFKPSADRRAAGRRALDVDDDRPLVALVGRYHRMKDHETFLRAAAMVRAARPEVAFILAGRNVDQSNAALSMLIETLGIAPSVRLLGVWPDVAQLWAAVDIAVCSSYSEGLPNTLGEAMASGTPCVSTDVGDCAALIGNTGRIVPPHDPVALADAMLALLDLPAAERRQLGVAARERIRTRYAIDDVAARYAALFETHARRTELNPAPVGSV